jgi:hypothetical protein
MKKFVSRRLLMTATLSLIAMALFILPANPHWFASAQATGAGQTFGDQKLSRQFRHEQLKARLATTRGAALRQSLSLLQRLDEPGALALWKAALDNPDAALKQEVWRAYQNLRLELERKEMVPQIARIQTTSAEVLRLAAGAKLEAHIWSASDRETTAAVPYYLLAELRDAGLAVEVLYDSVAEFQKAQRQGDALALSIAAARQAENPEKPLQARIAVVDLARRELPAAGYSDWLGDQENILCRTRRFSPIWMSFLRTGRPLP